MFQLLFEPLVSVCKATMNSYSLLAATVYSMNCVCVCVCVCVCLCMCVCVCVCVCTVCVQCDLFL